jgi:hypothetical protein
MLDISNKTGPKLKSSVNTINTHPSEKKVFTAPVNKYRERENQEKLNLNNAPSKESLGQKLDIQSIMGGIEQFYDNKGEQIQQLIQSNEVIFNSILNQINNQLDLDDSSRAKIFELVKARGYQNTPQLDIKYKPSFEDITNVENENNSYEGDNMGQLLAAKNTAVDYEHHYSQTIIVVNNILQQLQSSGIRIDNFVAVEYIKEYINIKAISEQVQSKAAELPQSQNEYTRGFNELVPDPVNFISKSFRVNTHYNTGEIIMGELENQVAARVGKNAEQELNKELSSIEEVAFVISGPGYSLLDTSEKVDSLTFIPNLPMSNEDKTTLSNLVNTLGNHTYQESLLTDYNNTNAKNIRMDEVDPQEHKDAQELIHKTKREIFIINAQITQNESQIIALKKQIDNLTSEPSGESELRIKQLNNQINQLNTKAINLEQNLSFQQKEISQRKIDARAIYHQYNPDGFATPIKLGPKDQITVYKNGESVEQIDNLDLDVVDINSIKTNINEMLLKYKIRVNSIQIKNNVSSDNVTKALTNGKIKGAIGLQAKNKNNTDNNTRKEAIKKSLNIDFGI